MAFCTTEFDTPHTYFPLVRETWRTFKTQGFNTLYLSVCNTALVYDSSDHITTLCFLAVDGFA